MKYVISGASAQMGRMVADILLETVSSDELTLITRSPESLRSWADRGVTVLKGHHGDAESLIQGYEGADRLFMISSLAVGQRIKHHRDTIEVASVAGIKHITYTSVAGIHPLNPTRSAKEHLATEDMLRQSGISFTSLRNQIYSELLCLMIQEQALRTGKWVHNSRIGGFAPVARTDIARCAASIMLDPARHERVCYEITGPDRFTFPELAKVAERLWDRSIEYIAVSGNDMYDIFEKMGVPRTGDTSQTFVPKIFGSDELVQQFNAYEMGLMDIQSAHVEFITGEKPLSLETVFSGMIAAGQR